MRGVPLRFRDDGRVAVIPAIGDSLDQEKEAHPADECPQDSTLGHPILPIPDDEKHIRAPSLLVNSSAIGRYGQRHESDFLAYVRPGTLAGFTLAVARRKP